MVDLTLPTDGGDNGVWGPILNTALTAINDGKVERDELVVNVKDYGAVGDGTTDDITAIQAALGVAAAAQAELFFPGGTYKITTPLIVSLNSQMIRGAGKDATILLFTGTGSAITSGAGTTNYNRWNFSDFTVDTRQAAADTIGLDLNNVGRSYFQNLRLRCTTTAGGGIGIKFTGGDNTVARSTYYNVFVNVEISSTGKGIWGVGYATAQKFYGGIIDGAGSAIFVEQGSTASNMSSWMFNAVSVATANADMVVLGMASGHATSVTHFQFAACRFEPVGAGAITMHPNCTRAAFWGGITSGDVTVVDNGSLNTVMIPSLTTGSFRLAGFGKAGLALPSTTTDVGITIGGDTNLYRSAADTLKTDDALVVTGPVTAATVAVTGATVGTTAPAAGGADALPATPLGYMTVTINGTARKIAYY